MEDIKHININVPVPITIPIDPDARYVILLNGEIRDSSAINAIAHHLEDWWLNQDAKWLVIHIPGVEVQFQKVEKG